MKPIYTYGIATIIVLLLGYLISPWIYRSAVNELQNPLVHIIATRMNSGFIESMKIAIAIGTIPFFHFMIRKFSSPLSIKQSITNYVFIVAFGAIFVKTRMLYINYIFPNSSIMEPNNEMAFFIGHSFYKFWLFLLLGFAFASILFIIIPRINNRNSIGQNTDGK